jgi:hypothetical protein
MATLFHRNSRSNIVDILAKYKAISEREKEKIKPA